MLINKTLFELLCLVEEYGGFGLKYIALHSSLSYRSVYKYLSIFREMGIVTSDKGSYFLTENGSRLLEYLRRVYTIIENGGDRDECSED